MTKAARISSDVDRAVSDALAQLVRTSRWGDAVNVTLPMFYPSGTAVCLGITPTHFGFSVTDNGLAYREAEQIGATTYFAKNVPGVTEGMAVWHDTRALLSESSLEALAGAMADVAAASSRLVWKISSKLSKKVEAEIADHLFERLRHVFSDKRVERAQTIIGPSTKEWEVDAVVHLEGKTAIFQAVANHHLSVYQSAAMFHDLSLSETPPTSVGVVRSKEGMGAFFNILSQSGHVIEEAEADRVYRRAAEWPSS